MDCYNIMAVVISHRSKNAPDFQKVLTKYGCIVKMRLGLHEAGDVCSENGLIILQLAGSKDEISGFQKELNDLEGITSKVMEICAQ